MADDAARRYQKVPDIAVDVAHFLDGLPVSAYREGPFGHAWRWFSRNRAWILLLLAYMIARALVIFLRPR